MYRKVKSSELLPIRRASKHICSAKVGTCAAAMEGDLSAHVLSAWNGRLSCQLPINWVKFEIALCKLGEAAAQTQKQRRRH